MEGASNMAVDFTSYISALTSVITPADILTILASCVGVGIVFVLMWLGVRKINGAFFSALTKGKPKV